MGHHSWIRKFRLEVETRKILKLFYFILRFSSTLLSYSHSCFFHKNSHLHKPSEINSLSHYKISHFKSHTNPLVFWVSILTVTRHLSLSLSLSYWFLRKCCEKKKKKIWTWNWFLCLFMLYEMKPNQTELSF